LQVVLHQDELDLVERPGAALSQPFAECRGLAVLGILGRRQHDPPQSPRLFSALRRLAIDPQQLAIESNMTSLS
jgi:hypothetical protein